MVWLITFLLSHSTPTTLNAWACNRVYELKPANGTIENDGGCYDICWSHYQRNENLDGESHDLQNACAVVVYGGEY